MIYFFIGTIMKLLGIYFLLLSQYSISVPPENIKNLWLPSASSEAIEMEH